jgi:hypothetical protein
MGLEKKTTMTNLYINQRQLFDQPNSAKLEDVSKQLFGTNWQLHKRALMSQVFSTSGWYPRFGNNFSGNHNQNLVEVNCGIDLVRSLEIDKLTFANVTDQRFVKLANQYNDKPWLVCWSGGIDSTVIVTSIIKNLPAEKRSNVVIYCDPGSVWESPVFFHQHILPNFSVIDSTLFYQNFDSYQDQFYIIDGEPADCLWGNRHVPYLKDLALLDWKQHLTKLVEYIDLTVKHRDSAQWLVESVADNTQSVDLPIKTVSQWFWWVNFNFMYIDTFMRKAYAKSIALTQLNRFYVNWYHSQEYNQWSIQQQIMHNNRFDPSTYKLDAKIYVSDLFKNKYWRTFKTKGHSGSRYQPNIVYWISIQENDKFCYNIHDLI